MRSAWAAPPLRVVTSFSVLADMAREIAGHTAEVSTLVGPNADAHVFEPTPSDAQRLAQADLVIVNGLHFEGWMARLISASGYRGPVVIATQGITPRLAGGNTDPHAWQDLNHVQRYVANIRDGLIALAPQHASEIQARANNYLGRIDALARRVQAQMNALPAGQRRIITSHDAFGYFGAAHGVVFIAPQGWATDSEASAGQVARIIEQVRSQRVRALFVENITDPRLVQRIAQEAKVKVGGTLYSDALSPPGTVADTYLKMMAHNADTLSAALR